MNIERRSALGLSVAALMGGMLSTSMASPPGVDADLIHLCDELSRIGSALTDLYAIKGLTSDEEDAQQPEISRLYGEEDRVAAAIFEAQPPRTLEGFGAMARAAIAISPVDVHGDLVMEHRTTLKLAELMLRALAARELGA